MGTDLLSRKVFYKSLHAHPPDTLSIEQSNIGAQIGSIKNAAKKRILFFPKALRRVLPENPLNTDTSTLTLTH